jgi:hypothetical protein
VLAADDDGTTGWKDRNWDNDGQQAPNRGMRRRRQGGGDTQHPIEHGTGMGNTVTMWSWVCTGTGMGMGLPYPGNTVPFSMVLQVCVGMPVPGCQSGE